MKNLLLVLIIAIGTIDAAAQKLSTADQKNILKLNLFALAFKNVSIQYERVVSRKVSVAGLIRVMPKSKITFKSILKSFIDDPDTEKQLENTNAGNISFTPEVRYYLGRKGAPHGFYIAGYATLANYNADVPYTYTDVGITKNIQLSGHVTTVTGGFLIGAQMKLTRSIGLDFWILGPNYGTSNGNLNGQTPLNSSE